MSETKTAPRPVAAPKPTTDGYFWVRRAHKKREYLPPDRRYSIQYWEESRTFELIKIQDGDVLEFGTDELCVWEGSSEITIEVGPEVAPYPSEPQRD